MRTVLILMDTVKRDMLQIYNNNTYVKTPNITAFANEAVIFDNHFIGSAPCMPARRDIFTGRLGFLERSWGPIEPFDVTLQSVLRSHDIYTHITTDHCHYFRIGGEGYVQTFNTWDYHRGQEGDPWISQIDDPSNMPKDYYGRVRKQYQLNRTMWPNEEDYPSPKTFKSAMKFLDDNKNKDDFFLMVEAFDPHEPFDVPDSYMEMYEHAPLDREYFEIPNYSRVDVPDNAKDYIEKRYAALLSMSDHWFGKLIQHLKDLDMYDDTMIMFTTDHGYFLGERDYFGKNYMHLYNELAHLPFVVKFPHGEMSGQRVNAITQNIDIMPTILDFYDIEIPESVKGKSIKKVLDNTYSKDYALFGYHGMAMNIYDGKHVLLKAPNKDNKPCFEYTCIPTTIRKYLGVGVEQDIEMGRYIERSKYPVYKIPCLAPSIIDNVKNGLDEVKENKLFDLENDYSEVNNIYDEHSQTTIAMKELMIKALKENDAPLEQLERLSLV